MRVRGAHKWRRQRGVRLVRRVARTGFAEHGVELSVENLWPEPALAAIRATLDDPGRDRGAALQSFRCA